MVDVIKWPPVATVSKEWTVYDPVMTSVNVVTGGRKISGVQRRRRLATIEASSRFSPYQAGAGYMNSLIRLLKGGINLVELTHKPRTRDSRLLADIYRGSDYAGWIVPDDPIYWQDVDGTPVEWIDDSNGNLAYTIESNSGYSSVRITGLPPRVLFALPGEFAKFIMPTGTQTIAILAPAMSNSEGVGNLRLEAAPTAVGRIIIGAEDTGVFQVDQIPRAVEPGGSDWSFTWKFTEVYEDERGTFVYRNPWQMT